MRVLELDWGSSLGNSAFVKALLFIYGFVGWSVIFPAVGVPRTLVTGMVTVGGFLMVLTRSRGTIRWPLAAVALISLTALVPSLYWWNWSSFPLVWSLSLALVLTTYATEREIDGVIDLATVFVLLLLVGAIIAQFNNVLGGRPLGSFPRPGDEDARILVLPFTLALEGRLDGSPRISGIYDEPGAFSFVICLLAFLRRMRGRNPAITWALLGLGCITFSLAHLIFVVCFLLGGNYERKEILSIAAVGFFLLGLLAATPAGDMLVEQVGNRIFGEEIEGRLVRGDNRSERLALAFENLAAEGKSIVVGMGAAAESEIFKMVGENPLTPLVRYGILASWPYYVYLGFGVSCLFGGRKGLSFFGVALLFAQRPYVQSDGYSLLAILALWGQFGSHASRRNFLTGLKEGGKWCTRNTRSADCEAITKFGLIK